MSFWDKDSIDCKVKVILFDGTGEKAGVRADFLQETKIFELELYFLNILY